MSKGMDGLILMGGKSRRMGTEKSLLPFGGKPLYEWAKDKLSKHCDMTYLSVNASQAGFLRTSVPIIQDLHNDEGPLDGIMSGLKVTGKSLIVLAVDMPLITDKTLEELVRQRDPSKPATVYFDPLPQQWQMVAVWEPEALPVLESYWEKGNRSLQGFLNRHEARKITLTDPHEFTNINTPETYQRLIANTIRQQENNHDNE